MLSFFIKSIKLSDAECVFAVKLCLVICVHHVSYGEACTLRYKGSNAKSYHSELCPCLSIGCGFIDVVSEMEELLSELYQVLVFLSRLFCC